VLSGRMRNARADWALSVALLVISQVEVWAFGRLGGTVLAAVLAGFAALLVRWRRTRPLLVAATVCALLAGAAQVSLANDVEPISVTFIAILIVTWFTLGGLPNRRRAGLGLLLGLVFAVVATSPFRVDIYLAIAFTCFGVPWLLGSLLWMRSEVASALERTQAADAAQVVRIAADPSVLAALSPRESEVLMLMAVGRSNAEIAAELHLSLATVKTHVMSILRKLGVRDRTQAVVVALSRGPHV
jgi:DNA-binding CsgD family transcriptional regulator